MDYIDHMIFISKKWNYGGVALFSHFHKVLALSKFALLKCEIEVNPISWIPQATSTVQFQFAQPRESVLQGSLQFCTLKVRILKVLILCQSAKVKQCYPWHVSILKKPVPDRVLPWLIILILLYRSSRPTEVPDLLTTSITTSDEDITLSGFGARSTEKSVKLPTTTSVPAPGQNVPVVSTTQRNRLTDFFRSRGTRRPFNFKNRANRVRTTRWVIYQCWEM